MRWDKVDLPRKGYSYLNSQHFCSSCSILSSTPNISFLPSLAFAYISPQLIPKGDQSLLSTNELPNIPSVIDSRELNFSSFQRRCWCDGRDVRAGIFNCGLDHQSLNLGDTIQSLENGLSEVDRYLGTASQLGKLVIPEVIMSDLEGLPVWK